MPLIPQQDIIYIPHASLSQIPKGHSIAQDTIRRFKATLAGYPPCKIISIAWDSGNLIAVIETV
jgi:hypothetical protein